MKYSKWKIAYFLNFFNIYFLREREREREMFKNGGGAEREEMETQNPKHTPSPELSAQSPM